MPLEKEWYRLGSLDSLGLAFEKSLPDFSSKSCLLLTKLLISSFILAM